MRTAILLMLLVLAGSALANSNPIMSGCAPLPGEDGRVCRSADQLADMSARLCRFGSSGAGACDAIDGEHVSRDAVDRYLQGETHRDLAFQRALGARLPLGESVWPSTHNSFNAEVYQPTVSGLDPNQVYAIGDQLDMDIRIVELDAHWWPNITSAGDEPVMCHSEDEGHGAHVGCTTERLLSSGLAEVRAWLDAHAGEVVIVYIEDHLDAPAGYDRGAQMVQAALGDILYTPADAGRACGSGWPLDKSRDDIMAAGKQVMIVSGCGQSAAWSSLAFSYGTNVFQGGPEDITPYPACGGLAYDSKFVRLYEDRTWLTYMQTPQAQMTPVITREITKCPVNMPGFDLLSPTDGRLDALVWSWAPGEPSAPGCVAQRADGRLASVDCGAPLAYACRSGAGWTTSATRAGCAFDVPRTGYDAQGLLDAHPGSAVFVDLIT